MASAAGFAFFHDIPHWCFLLVADITSVPFVQTSLVIIACHLTAALLVSLCQTVRVLWTLLILMSARSTLTALSGQLTPEFLILGHLYQSASIHHPRMSWRAEKPGRLAFPGMNKHSLFSLSVRLWIFLVSHTVLCYVWSAVNVVSRHFKICFRIAWVCCPWSWLEYIWRGWEAMVISLSASSLWRVPCLLSDLPFFTLRMNSVFFVSYCVCSQVGTLLVSRNLRTLPFNCFLMFPWGRQFCLTILPTYTQSTIKSKLSHLHCAQHHILCNV